MGGSIVVAVRVRRSVQCVVATERTTSAVTVSIWAVLEYAIDGPAAGSLTSGLAHAAVPIVLSACTVDSRRGIGLAGRAGSGARIVEAPGG
jgi:hypothetical protein